MGGAREAVSAVQRALVNSIEPLAAAGIVVPKTGRSVNQARGFTHQPLVGGAPDTWVALRSEVEAAKGDTIFLFFPGILRLGGSTKRRRELVARLSALADDVCLVSAITDQLTLINDFYVSQVSAWRISRRLEGALPRLLESDLFAHERLLQPWYEDSAVRYAAIPLAELTAGRPIGAVLGSVGVEVDESIVLPPPGDPPARLGPIGVEANRLLSTYLRAEIRGFTADEHGVAAASRAGLARAARLGWCADPFWGWTAAAAEKAIGHFGAANNRFARSVWGTDWTLGYPIERPSTRVEFLDLDFQVVDQVQRYVVELADKVARERRVAR